MFYIKFSNISLTKEKYFKFYNFVLRKERETPYIQRVDLQRRFFLRIHVVSKQEKNFNLQYLKCLYLKRITLRTSHPT